MEMEVVMYKCLPRKGESVRMKYGSQRRLFKNRKQNKAKKLTWWKAPYFKTNKIYLNDSIEIACYSMLTWYMLWVSGHYVFPNESFYDSCLTLLLHEYIDQPRHSCIYYLMLSGQPLGSCSQISQRGLHIIQRSRA